MQEVPWFISFAFPYPTPCTPEELLKVLKRLAADWPGWEHFPWRVTRDIHLFLGRPPVNFHYLMINRCLTGFAAHLVLTLEFESQADVLAMMLRERFEIVGVLRVLLVDALRSEMRFSKRSSIPDCSGVEDGHEHVAPEELEKRRQTFRDCIEGAAREYRKILDLASQALSMDEWILGRPLRAWARGGDMPEPVTLTVQTEEAAAGRVLRPRQEEVARFVAEGKRVPRLLVTHAREGREAGAEGKVTGGKPSVTGDQGEKKRVRACGRGREAAGAAGSGSGQGGESKPVARVFGDFHRIELPSGRVMTLHRKRKRRAFLRAAHEWCEKSGTDAFYWETVIEEHNARYNGRGDAHRRIKSDRVDDDLFRGQKEEFRELFGEPDRANGRLRFAVRLEFA